ncbi:hypothetical protein IAQ61_001989 [Plenodomus lingam]|uniref:uncharacterized protein n=1 Tax=Leptosphaeria maculans TaxID=5022 RepID=UPI003320E8A5|nr:hypothetical protein IAQ61_001989 [Plenodomus lingam]
MSGLLEFPPSTLPPDALSHPYAVFAIRKVDVESALPKDIPLNAVLHFIPKLRECVLPVPFIGGLPKSLATVALRAPYVGINIESRDISALGLKWVMKRLLQAAGRVHPRTLFLTQPSVGVAVTIYRTWMALELPAAGVKNLVTHILTRLMMGPPVAIWEMNLIWASFPHDSDIIREMGMNSLRSHLNFNQSPSDTAALTDWYNVDSARRNFSHSIGRYFPGICLDREQAVRERINNLYLKTKQKEIAEAARHDKGKRQEEQKTRGTAEKVKNLLNQDGTREASPDEKRKRRKEYCKALESRLRRARSDDSIRSVETAIWDPKGSTETARPSKQKPLSLSTQCALLAQAERNHEAAVSRGRLWKRTDSASILTAENLTELNKVSLSDTKSATSN